VPVAPLAPVVPAVPVADPPELPAFPVPPGAGLEPHPALNSNMAPRTRTNGGEVI
jgi:hypothetical protein